MRKVACNILNNFWNETCREVLYKATRYEELCNFGSCKQKKFLEITVQWENLMTVKFGEIAQKGWLAS